MSWQQILDIAGFAVYFVAGVGGCLYLAWKCA